MFIFGGVDQYPATYSNSYYSLARTGVEPADTLTVSLCTAAADLPRHLPVYITYRAPAVRPPPTLTFAYRIWNPYARVAHIGPT